MGKPKRNVLAAAEETITPPDELAPTQSLARVLKAEGNSMYSCELPSNGKDSKTVVVELAARFRNTIWIKRGGYVLVELIPEEDRKEGSKMDGALLDCI